NVRPPWGRKGQRPASTEIEYLSAKENRKLTLTLPEQQDDRKAGTYKPERGPLVLAPENRGTAACGMAAAPRTHYREFSSLGNGCSPRKFVSIGWAGWFA